MSGRDVDFGESGKIMTFTTASLTEGSNLGHIVTVSGNNTVEAGSDGKPVLGALRRISKAGTEASIQANGVIKDVPYKTGNAPTIGTIVQFSAANEVDALADMKNATGWMVISLDTENETCDIMKV